MCCYCSNDQQLSAQLSYQLLSALLSAIGCCQLLSAASYQLSAAISEAISYQLLSAAISYQLSAFSIVSRCASRGRCASRNRVARSPQLADRRSVTRASQPHLPVLTCLFWQVRDFALCLQACMAACLLSLTLSGRISLCACRMASFFPTRPPR